MSALPGVSVEMKNPVREHRVQTKESRKSMSTQIVPFASEKFIANEVSFACPAMRYGGYLYVIEFDSGLIKVGRSDNPSNRLGAHEANARGFGVSMKRFWVSPAHDNYAANERSLIAAIAGIAQGRNKSEYFTGVTYEQAVSFALELVFAPIDFEAHERAARESAEAMQDFLESTWGPARRNRDFPESDNPWALWGAPIADMFHALRSSLQESEGPPINGETEAVWAEASAAMGMSFEDMKGKSQVDVIEMIAGLFVRISSQQLKLWAFETGRLDLVRPMGAEQVS